MPGMTSGAAADLGLGSTLSQQQQDETEEEKRRRLLGLPPLARESTAAQMLFGFGAGAGTSPATGLGSVRGRGY